MTTMSPEYLAGLIVGIALGLPCGVILWAAIPPLVRFAVHHGRL